MRVALVCSLEVGGPLEHSLVLARALAAAGVEVRGVCATPALAARFAAAGAEPVVAPLRHAADVPGARRLRDALAGVDVVHAQDRRSGLWTRVLRLPARRVYTAHGLPEPYLPYPLGNRRPGPRAQLAYRGLDAGLARRRTDAVIVASHALAGIFVRRIGYPAERITVIPNGIEVGEPLPARGRAVGTLSVLEPVKGLVTFVCAAVMLSSRRPGLPLVMFGTGSEAGVLRKVADHLGLPLAMPGHVPTREALAQLAVLALPSRMENSPMVLLEAMAAGVPVVASRVGGIPELAPPGTAQLVPPGDTRALREAIERLLDDADLRERQVAAARAHVEAHGTAALMARRTLGVYESIA